MEENKESTLEEIKEGIEEMEKITKGKAIFDFIQSKLISRRFMVFILASVFLGLKMISADNWVLISGCYIGSTSLVEFGNVLKGRGVKEE